MKNAVQKLTLSALFIALGLVLPFLTGQLQQIGNMMLPMHIPVFLCGLICGWKYGLAVGFIVPLFRSFLFTMPALYPNAVGMAFELATYGAVAGYLYGRSRWQCVRALYRSILAAMAAGRIVWGVVRVVLLGLWNTPFSFAMFLAQGFTNAIPGIILQLTLIPAIMVALHRAKLVPLHHHAGTCKDHANHADF